jgi:hypothetical protein
MKRITRTRTLIRQHEVLTVRNPLPRQSVCCSECSEHVALVALGEAVRLSGINSRAIYRLIEEREIHFMETTDGLALICPASLLKWVRQELFG